MNNKPFSSTIIIIIAAIAIVSIGAWFLFWNTAPTHTIVPPGIACTQEAKQCPDGSYVARTGPQCQFAACPTTNNQTTTDSMGGVGGPYHITSMVPASGPIGTQISMSGNFSGLEYATIFHFKNEATGKDAEIDFMPNKNTGGFIVQEFMCQKTMGGSGMPCPATSSFLITPGKYWVYFENLETHQISNKEEFTVTK